MYVSLFNQDLSQAFSAAYSDYHTFNNALPLISQITIALERNNLSLSGFHLNHEYIAFSGNTKPLTPKQLPLLSLLHSGLLTEGNIREETLRLPNGVNPILWGSLEFSSLDGVTPILLPDDTEIMPIILTFSQDPNDASRYHPIILFYFRAKGYRKPLTLSFSFTETLPDFLIEDQLGVTKSPLVHPQSSSSVYWLYWKKSDIIEEGFKSSLYLAESFLRRMFFSPKRFKFTF